MDPLARKVADRHCPCAGDQPEDKEAVAPPGWENTVKKMKKHPGEIDNPWALAWHMKNKGDKPGGKEAFLEAGPTADSRFPEKPSVQPKSESEGEQNTMKSGYDRRIASDPKLQKFLGHLKAFVNAGYTLSREWEALEGSHCDLLATGYPRHLPSFDEFTGELQAWYEAVERASQKL